MFQLNTGEKPLDFNEKDQDRNNIKINLQEAYYFSSDSR